MVGLGSFIFFLLGADKCCLELLIGLRFLLFSCFKTVSLEEHFRPVSSSQLDEGSAGGWLGYKTNSSSSPHRQLAGFRNELMSYTTNFSHDDLQLHSVQLN
jgi:hypothetical protein